jgi:hypothetical protein
MQFTDDTTGQWTNHEQSPNFELMARFRLQMINTPGMTVAWAKEHTFAELQVWTQSAAHKLQTRCILGPVLQLTCSTRPKNDVQGMPIKYNTKIDVLTFMKSFALAFHKEQATQYWEQFEKMAHTTALKMLVTYEAFCSIIRDSGTTHDELKKSFKAAQHVARDFYFAYNNWELAYDAYIAFDLPRIQMERQDGGFALEYFDWYPCNGVLATELVHNPSFKLNSLGGVLKEAPAYRQMYARLFKNYADLIQTELNANPPHYTTLNKILKQLGVIIKTLCRYLGQMQLWTHQPNSLPVDNLEMPPWDICMTTLREYGSSLNQAHTWILSQCKNAPSSGSAYAVIETKMEELDLLPPCAVTRMTGFTSVMFRIIDYQVTVKRVAISARIYYLAHRCSSPLEWLTKSTHVNLVDNSFVLDNTKQMIEKVLAEERKDGRVHINNLIYATDNSKATFTQLMVAFVIEVILRRQTHFPETLRFEQSRIDNLRLDFGLNVVLAVLTDVAEKWAQSGENNEYDGPPLLQGAAPCIYKHEEPDAYMQAICESLSSTTDHAKIASRDIKTRVDAVVAALAEKFPALRDQRAVNDVRPTLDQLHRALLSVTSDTYMYKQAASKILTTMVKAFIDPEEPDLTEFSIWVKYTIGTRLINDARSLHTIFSTTMHVYGDQYADIVTEIADRFVCVCTKPDADMPFQGLLHLDDPWSRPRGMARDGAPYLLPPNSGICTCAFRTMCL